MSALEKVKAAAAELPPDDQVELFRWWIESDMFKQRQLAALKRDLSVGIEQLDEGLYTVHDETNTLQLAEEVGKGARERLKAKQTGHKK